MIGRRRRPAGSPTTRRSCTAATSPRASDRHDAVLRGQQRRSCVARTPAERAPGPARRRTSSRSRAAASAGRPRHRHGDHSRHPPTPRDRRGRGRSAARRSHGVAVEDHRRRARLSERACGSASPTPGSTTRWRPRHPAVAQHAASTVLGDRAGRRCARTRTARATPARIAHCASPVPIDDEQTHHGDPADQPRVPTSPPWPSRRRGACRRVRPTADPGRRPSRASAGVAPRPARRRATGRRLDQAHRRHVGRPGRGRQARRRAVSPRGRSVVVVADRRRRRSWRRRRRRRAWPWSSAVVPTRRRGVRVGRRRRRRRTVGGAASRGAGDVTPGSRRGTSGVRPVEVERLVVEVGRRTRPTRRSRSSSKPGLLDVACADRGELDVARRVLDRAVVDARSTSRRRRRQPLVGDARNTGVLVVELGVASTSWRPRSPEHPRPRCRRPGGARCCCRRR